jgi:hypothetical protein
VHGSAAAQAQEEAAKVVCKRVRVKGFEEAIEARLQARQDVRRQESATPTKPVSAAPGWVASVAGAAVPEPSAAGRR